MLYSDLTSKNVKIELGKPLDCVTLKDGELKNIEYRTLILGEVMFSMEHEQLVKLTALLERELYGMTWDELDEKVGILEERIDNQLNYIEMLEQAE